jgi:hypothetical protein
MTWSEELGKFLKEIRLNSRFFRWLFIVAGIALIAFVLSRIPNGIRTYYLWERLQATPAVVMTYKVTKTKHEESFIGNGPDLVIEYLVLEFEAKYQFNNKEYVCSTYSLAGKNAYTGKNEVKLKSESGYVLLNFISAWKESPKVIIWVDPLNPNYAVVDKSFSISDHIVASVIIGFFGFVFLLVGLR